MVDVGRLSVRSATLTAPSGLSLVRIAASPIPMRLRKVKKKQNPAFASAIAIVRLSGYYPIFAENGLGTFLETLCVSGTY
jgi:hypothetical protein